MASRDPQALHRQATLRLAGAALVTFAALLGLGSYYGLPIVVAGSLHWFLLAVLAAGTGLGVVAPRWSLLARPVGALLVLGAGFVVYLLAGSTWYQLGNPAQVEASTHWAFGGLFVAVAVGAAVAAQYFQSSPHNQLPDARGLASTSRVGTWLALVGAAVSFAWALGQPMLEAESVLAVLLVPCLLAIELLFAGLVGFVRRPSHGAFGAGLIGSRFLGSSFNPVESIFTAIEITFDVDVRSSWALGYLRRTAPPVAVAIAASAWLLSGVVVVDASQQGVRERFGQVNEEQVLEPGLHLGLPWPFDRVRRVDVMRVRDLPIGYTDAKAGAQALWTQLHAAEEYNLLLGDGRDLVTVNGELQYRIRDIHAWLYGCQNPEEALETLAYRVLMEATVDKDARPGIVSGYRWVFHALP